MRLDIWLDVACLFRTRSEAQKACRLGQVSVNGVSAKPHRELKGGERLELQRPFGRRQTVVVQALADAHVPKAQARALYEDQTPEPSVHEVEMRRLERLYRAAAKTTARPTRDERRARRRMSGKD